MNIEELTQSMNQAEAEHDFNEIESMADLYRRIKQAGELWRIEHTEIKIISKGPRKGETETKIPIPSPVDVAENLNKLCHFTFIGRGGISDSSPVYTFDWDSGVYTHSRDLLWRLCRAFDGRLKSPHYKEVEMQLRTMIKMKRPLEDRNLIPVNNGIFNLKDKTFRPHAPQFIITSKIKTSYNPEAEKPILGGWFDFDEWLDGIAVGDEDVVTLLWQIMNEAINPNYTRGKIVLLLGDGNNGKGTYQDLLKNLIGQENVAALRPDQFEGHKPEMLLGKVCNIGDDISNKYLDEVSDLMSIATGDTVMINPKHEKPVELTTKPLCLFSANALPNSRNKSQGWYRRLCIVPFNADFNGQKERPEIKQVFLKDRELLEWVLFKILNMENFKKFIEPEVTKTMLEEYKSDNDYILGFVKNRYIPNGWDGLTHVPIGFLKRELSEYAQDEGISNPQLYGAGKRVVAVLNKETEGRYEIKSGRVAFGDEKILDPFGFFQKDLVGARRGISKIR